jgi:hypothetical protein
MRESNARVGRLFGVIAGMVLSTSGCDSGRAPAAPTPPQTPPSATCSFSVSLSVARFGPGGGTSTASVTAPAGCAWSARSHADWVTLEGASNRAGNGDVGIAVGAFSGSAERTAILSIAEQNLNLTQTGCDFRLQPAELSFGGEGGSADVRIDAQAGCRWRFEPPPSWVSFDPPAGDGPATVRVRADRNPSASSRDVALEIGAATLTLRQETSPPAPLPPPPDACNYSVNPVAAYVSFRGGTGLVNVNTSPACSWTAVAGVPWMRLRRGSSGTGSGQIDYEVEANPETYVVDFRKGAIEVRWSAPTAGQNVWLSQFGDCRTQLIGNDPANPGTVRFPAAGGTFNVFILVESPFNCPWRFEGAAPWVSTTLRPDVIHRGDGNVHVTALPNPSPAERMVILTIAEKPLTVRQAGN